MRLPSGVCVLEVRERVRCALDELDSMETTKYALAHWLAGSYRAALVDDGRDHWPVVVGLMSSVETAILDAKSAVNLARDAARRFELVRVLPPRILVVRVLDEHGATGFAPVGVAEASLSTRALSLLVADYMTRPMAYGEDSRSDRWLA